jgi:5'-deoxynucleotidase
VEERKAGNHEFLSAERQTLEWLRAQHMREIDYFLEHFAPAFELDLDELGSIQ